MRESGGRLRCNTGSSGANSIRLRFRPMRWTIVGSTLALLLLSELAWAQPRETPFIEGRRALAVRGERYGTLPDDHGLTLRVREVFQKIVRAAGQRPGLAFEIHVLDTPRIILEALRGGLVVISRGAVDLARSDDNALAFLLAHEVAHLVRDHDAILESLGVLGGVTSGGSSAQSEEVLRAYHAVELDADRLGVLFSALAGYRASAAIPVLTRLIEQSGPDLFHPDPKERASAIRERIAEVADHLEVFHLGLFLLSLGRYLDAVRVLEHFLSLFPSREVLSAVGVAYHKEALRYAPAPLFRHVLVVDAATRAPAPKGAPDAIYRQFTERALHYYTLAVAADPGYAPALNNLGAAYLDLGERELALGHINRALKQAPQLASAYNNRGVAWAMARDYARAEEDWLTAARLDPGLRQSAYNLTRLYEARGRADDARQWAPRASPPERNGKEGAPPNVGSISPGMPLNRLAEWLNEPGVRQIKLPLGGSDGDLTLLVFSRRGLAVVARDNSVEIVGSIPYARITTAQGLRPGDPVARVEAIYGPPSALDGVQALNIFGYPAQALAVFVVNSRVQAVWAGRPRAQR